MRLTSLLPLTLGVAMTLALAGYRFGESNHAVYLVDALRRNDPALLANDWWTRSTLQYHFVFNRLSAWLMRTGTIEPAFLGGYVGLVVLLHVAWRRLVLCLGGCESAYLVSVILYQLMAAGTGLGMYQFLQDSSFLPSNIANVAMLWGVYLWVRGRVAWSGLAFGLAGLFHLNHALAGIGLWMGLTLLPIVRRRISGRNLGSEISASGFQMRAGARPYLVGTALLLALSLPAILPAVKSVLTKTASLPLKDFVDLYVRLRHPHHYDPSSWPAALWLTFFLPIDVAIPASRLMGRDATRAPQLRRAVDAFSLFLAMLAVALLGAGVFYVSEPLIQMSLFRFSIYPKLLSCVATAWLIWRYPAARMTLRIILAAMLLGLTAFIVARSRSGDAPTFLAANAFPMWLFTLFALVALLRPRVLGWGRALFGTIVSTCVVVSLVLSWHKLGITHEGLRGDDAGYLEVCRWAQRNTPVDAVFLVPPDEQSFRLHGQRAIVINFKNVPQLSGELGEWRDRLQAVLQTPDLRTLPHPFRQTLDAIRQRYARLAPGYLSAVARRYGARYVVTVRRLDSPDLGEPVFSDSARKYFLYDLDAVRSQRLASEAAKHRGSTLTPDPSPP